jgi:hypothetical protein
MYVDSALTGLRSRLGQSDITQDERYALQSSLDWYNMQKVAFFQPLTNTAHFLGIVVVIVSIVYAAISVVQDSFMAQRMRKEIKQLPVEEEPKTNVQPLATRKSGFPIAAGILALVASGIIVLVSIVALVAAVQLFGYVYLGASNAAGLLGVSVWNMLSFSFGLTSGVFVLKRQQFGLSVFGISLLLTGGCVTVLGFGWIAGNSWVTGLPFGVPVIVLAILGLVFVSISKREFQ